MSPVDATPRLVADVGGTNTRIGIYDPASNTFRARTDFANRDFNGLEDVIRAWLAGLVESPPERACLAVAAPGGEDRVSMVNVDWSFSRREIQERFGWHVTGWLNDFEANAHGLPHLAPDERVTLRSGWAPQQGKLAVLGPGTGLGGASLLRVDGVAVAGAAEPGHASLSPGNALELELFALLLQQHADVYTELLVSGPGLERLYGTLAQLHGRAAETLSPADITARGLAGEDELCGQALDTFCALLGSACGDFVLHNGAWGGLYLAGGIVPRLTEYLQSSDFFQRLEAKGAMRERLARLPVHVITASHPGLLGAAHAPLPRD